MKKKKKKKRKLRPNHLKLIQTKIPRMLNQKPLYQKLWKKRILVHCWLEALKLEIMVAAVTVAQGELAKMNLILDHGK